ncbi:porin family protein [Flavobacterium sp.]|uniref:porin family protein n=1 Tax=Flavobacterium sp. TaxID=239 RepID=UPI0040331759
MKKKLFAAAALMLGLSALAQEQPPLEATGIVRYGLKGGLNVASLRGDVDEPSPRLGVHFGVTAEIRVSERFSIQPELMYSMQGIKEEGSLMIDGNFVEGEATTKLDYIILPIMAKIYMTEGFTLEVGPQLGLLNSARVKYDIRSSNDTFSGSTDISNQMKSLDFAVNAGLGYKLPSGLFFQGRYTLGLTNAYDGDEAEIKNGVVQFSIGYQFK